MKNRLMAVSFSLVVLFLLGVCTIASADNAAGVDVKISYLYGNTNAVALVDGDQDADNPVEVVNLYITLVDANGNPATAGPKGQALKDVTATITSTLGNPVTGDIEPGKFLAIAETVRFDTPSGTGATTRANISYIDAQLTRAKDVDQIIVSVANDPDPSIKGDATANVWAPAADSLVVRTFRDLPVPNVLFEDLSVDGTYGQKNNNNATQQAGSSVSFWVIANYADDRYTFAPELEGTVVTVSAYGDYSADDGETFGGPGDVPGFESDPINTATATFINGVASGTIQINRGGPEGLDVVLTAHVDGGVETTLMNPGGIDDVIGDDEDPDVDYVTMLSNKATGIVLISDDPAGDPYETGNYIIPDGCLPVLSTGVPQGYAVVLVDPLGNAWMNNTGQTLEFESALSGLNTTGDPDGADITQFGGAAIGTTAIEVSNGSYGESAVDMVAAGGAPNVGGTGTLTVEGAETNVALANAGTQAKVALNYAVDGDPDVLVENNEAADEDVAVGDTIVLTLIDNDRQMDSIATQAGDRIIIRAFDVTNDVQLQKIAKAGESFANASDEIELNVTDGDSKTDGYQISIVSYSAAEGNVNFQIEDITRCFTAEGAAGQDILGILPGPPFDILITGVAVGVTYDGSLTDDPIVITNEVSADGTPFDILSGDGEDNDLILVDEYGNTVDRAPDFDCRSTPGLSNPVADAPDEEAPSGIVLHVPEYAPIAVDKTDVLVCEDIDLVGSQSFEIGPIVLSPGSTKATMLEIINEGPQNQSGEQIDPACGGEAIIRISADGTSENDRPILITLTGDGELRGMPNGGPLPNPYDTVLSFDGLPQDVRVIVSTSGTATVKVEDKTTSEPLKLAEAIIKGDCGGCENPSCTITCDPTQPEAAGTTACTVETKSSTGETCTGSYTWEISQTACTADGGGSIDPTSGATTTYTADDEVCQETLTATDAANNTSCNYQIGCESAVTISGPSTLDCTAPGTYTAQTTCGDATISGTYSWEVDGVAAGTGGSIQVACTENGATKTVTVTDTANGDISTTLSITCACGASIDATFQGCGRAIALGFGIVRIQGDGTEFGPLSIVQYDSRQVIKGLKLVNRTDQTITQFVLLLPSFGPFLPVLFPEYPNTVEVTVGGSSDTFEILSCR